MSPHDSKLSDIAARAGRSNAARPLFTADGQRVSMIQLNRDEKGRVVRESVRKPLPSLLPSFIGIGLNALSFLLNLVAVVLFLHPVNIVTALVILAGLKWLMLPAYRAKIIQRQETREKNLDRVEDWIIETELPSPSPQLAEFERELYGEPEPAYTIEPQTDADKRESAITKELDALMDMLPGADPGTRREILNAMKDLEQERRELEHERAKDEYDEVLRPKAIAGALRVPPILMGREEPPCDCRSFNCGRKHKSLIEQQADLKARLLALMESNNGNRSSWG
jgi:hypothetical protein